MADTKIKISVVIGLVLSCIIIVVTALCFSYVEYYEFGFIRQRSTGVVDLSEVHTAGRYFLGPDREFKIFEADAHFIELNDIAVFTSDKLEVGLTVYFQYFLRKEDLPLLHAAYDIYYKDVIKTSAQDALKGATTSFNTRDMITSRAILEATLFRAVSDRIGGTCCRQNCTSFVYACPLGCKPSVTCTTDDRGLFADVRYFQLGSVRISSSVKERFMKALTLQEENDTEKLKQQAQIIRKNTTAKVKMIQNEAEEMLQQATADANYIRALSDANYTATVEKARSEGLKQVT
ncbi:uncharacterized protein LOC117315528 [Pecten maximus]|uniref:uncharacterized protein LOC117315528 n=1 Tax=Pecten maximus TaxID=6579 RepID=UPI001458EE66|nr:uncharacterized protein LOC117315528 [Pecten maximus]